MGTGPDICTNRDKQDLWRDKNRKDWAYDFQYKGKRYGGRGFRTKADARTAMEKRRKEWKDAHPNAEGQRRGRLADYRTIRDEDAPEGSYREIELDELALPNYLKQAYSWAFIFEEARQARYLFEVLGEIEPSEGAGS